YEYRQKVLTVDAIAVRQSGSAVIQRATLGYLADRRSADVLPDFPGDATQAQLFLAQWTPITEQRSEPYARYEMFTPRYVVLRDLAPFARGGTRQLGPFFRARVSEGLPELGATFRALGLGVTGGYGVAPAGGYGYLALAASARLRSDDGQWIDQLGT